jgi:hypothetical protein
MEHIEGYGGKHTMKLREHPSMSYRGICNWPPKWTSARQSESEDEPPRGEIGILKGVLLNDDSEAELILIIAHEGSRCMGSLRFEDPWFCAQIYSLLQFHLERAITAIGNLELPED